MKYQEQRVAGNNGELQDRSNVSCCHRLWDNILWLRLLITTWLWERPYKDNDQLHLGRRREKVRMSLISPCKAKCYFKVTLILNTNALLNGSPSLTLEQNQEMFVTVQRYIIDSRRFDQRHWDKIVLKQFRCGIRATNKKGLINSKYSVIRIQYVSHFFLIDEYTNLLLNNQRKSLT